MQLSKTEKYTAQEGLFMKEKKHCLVLGFTGLITASLLLGCSSSGTKDQPEVATATAPATTLASQEQVAVTQTADRPGKLEAELVVISAKVKAINKKSRVVTLKYPDGKEAKVKCGSEVRNFAQIRVGDDVTATFLESVELFVTGAGKASADQATEVERAPLGSKPGFAAVNAVEVKATVEAIDYQTREVILKGPDGKSVKIKAGPEVKRFNEVVKGDTVVARLTRAASIKVSTPTKN